MSDTKDGGYIAGPMRKHDDYNFPAFYEAEDYLWGGTSGVFFGDLFNPARRDVQHYNLGYIRDGEDRFSPRQAGLVLRSMEEDFDLAGALKADLTWIADNAKAIILLPGWQHSTGARTEAALGVALGLDLYEYHPELSSTGSRLTTYTPPEMHTDAEWAAIKTGQEYKTVDSPYGPVEVLLDHKVGPDFGITNIYTELPDGRLEYELSDGAKIVASQPLPVYTPGEIRTTSETGGEKGTKLARYDLIPVRALREVAKHFGRGARKYADHNWRRGYPWSLSYAAGSRHWNDFWEGKDYDVCSNDPESCLHVKDGEEWVGEPDTCWNHTGSHHLIAAVWHGLVQYEFTHDFPQYDDRYIPTKGEDHGTQD